MSQETTEATAKIVEFEKTKDVETLRSAMYTLGKVNLAAESDTAKWLALRKDVLHVWLALVAEIDRNLDRKFGPNEEHYVTVMPPPEDGAQLPPGASPEMIKDPQKRKQYEEAIKENDRKTLEYNFQTRLRRFDDLVMPNLARFLRVAYSSAPPDQRELSGAVQELIADPSRADLIRRAGSGKGN